jgi:hypothetical protein
VFERFAAGLAQREVVTGDFRRAADADAVAQAGDGDDGPFNNQFSVAATM